MALIKWRDSYSTGVEFFDNEHKKIVSLINEMFEVNRDHLGDDATQKIINEVLQYADYHFQHEEKAMEAVNYVNIEEHRQKHDDLKINVRELKERLNQGEKDIVVKFYLFLRDWLTQHILECDKQYAIAFKNKNVKELLGD